LKIEEKFAQMKKTQFFENYHKNNLALMVEKLEFELINIAPNEDFHTMSIMQLYPYHKNKFDSQKDLFNLSKMN